MELVNCLALINTNSRYSLTLTWVGKISGGGEDYVFSEEHVLFGGLCLLQSALDIQKGLQRFFVFASYRTFADEPSQEQAVRFAVANKSLHVFPTGGGKSLTFQVPTLMSGSC